jgi:hypothetical protein
MATFYRTQPGPNSFIPSSFQDQWYSNEEPLNSTQSSYVSNNLNNYDSGQMSTGPSEDEDYENEPPLLEELGIRFDHIWSKTQAVVHLLKVLRLFSD